MNGQHIIVATNYEERAMECLQNARFIDLVLLEHDLGGGYSLQYVRYDPIIKWLQLAIIDETGTGNIELEDLDIYVDGELISGIWNGINKSYTVSRLTLLVDKVTLKHEVRVENEGEGVVAMIYA